MLRQLKRTLYYLSLCSDISRLVTMSLGGHSVNFRNQEPTNAQEDGVFVWACTCVPSFGERVPLSPPKEERWLIISCPVGGSEGWTTATQVLTVCLCVELIWEVNKHNALSLVALTGWEHRWLCSQNPLCSEPLNGGAVLPAPS